MIRQRGEAKKVIFEATKNIKRITLCRCFAVRAATKALSDVTTTFCTKWMVPAITLCHYAHESMRREWWASA